MDSVTPGWGAGRGSLGKSPPSLMALLLWEQERWGSRKSTAAVQGHLETHGRRQELEAPPGGGESQALNLTHFRLFLVVDEEHFYRILASLRPGLLNQWPGSLTVAAGWSPTQILSSRHQSGGPPWPSSSSSSQSPHVTPDT